MRRVRRLLGTFVGAWLLGQCVTLAAATVALAARPSGDAACTCGHRAEEACPMHEDKTPAAARRCILRRDTDDSRMVLGSVLSQAGPVPSSTVSRPDAGSTAGPLAAKPFRRDSILPPEAPPPRR